MKISAQKGFTIVELLIVVVVIAILAAVSVVAYTGIQDRAIASTVKSDLANFSKKIEIAKINSGEDLYPLSLTQSMDISVTKSAYMPTRTNWLYVRVPSDRTSYLVAVIDSRGRGYFLTPGGTIQEGVVYSGAAAVAELGPGAGYSSGYTWNEATSTGNWASWAN